MAIKKRGKCFCLYRRVPKRYEAVEPRKFVWISLHTDSHSAAMQKEVPVWAEMIAMWEAKLAGDTSDAEKRYAAARELAKVKGFRYLPASDVANLPVEELLARVDAISGPISKPDLNEAAALLGGAKEPQITVSRALEMYWGLSRAQTLGKVKISCEDGKTQ
jgi:hypothetical protein